MRSGKQKKIKKEKKVKVSLPADEPDEQDDFHPGIFSGPDFDQE